MVTNPIEKVRATAHALASEPRAWPNLADDLDPQIVWDLAEKGLRAQRALREPDDKRVRELMATTGYTKFGFNSFESVTRAVIAALWKDVEQQ